MGSDCYRHCINLAYLVVGVVVVEVVFVYPGIGQLMVDSVTSRDIPVVQACALIFAATYITLNLIADIIGIISNPGFSIQDRLKEILNGRKSQ